jgi:hypothetical protein
MGQWEKAAFVRFIQEFSSPSWQPVQDYTVDLTLDTFDEFVRCSFSDRILHLKMPLVPTPFPLGLSLSYCLIV